MLKIVNIDIQSATNIRNVIKSRVKSENVENEILKGIDLVIEKGDRVELMPKKDGIKILAVHRDEIK